MIVRDATPADLPAIRRLYNALIATTTVAWRDDDASAEEIDAWFDERTRLGHPVLVAETDGLVIGYTCWTGFRGFPGYRHTVELTIHVDGEHHGRGVGRTLLGALVDEATRRDVHVVVAAIDADNRSSIAFHESMGFTEVARLPEVGRKFGRWLDLVLMQRILS